ncbi:MAG: hypothetical protein ACI4S0_09710 [Dorea sp.]
MSDEMIIRHCSPTLAGLKTGNIFKLKNLGIFAGGVVLAEAKQMNEERDSAEEAAIQEDITEECDTEVCGQTEGK